MDKVEGGDVYGHIAAMWRLGRLGKDFYVLRVERHDRNEVNVEGALVVGSGVADLGPGAVKARGVAQLYANLSLSERLQTRRLEPAIAF